MISRDLREIEWVARQTPCGCTHDRAHTTSPTRRLCLQHGPFDCRWMSEGSGFAVGAQRTVVLLLGLAAVAQCAVGVRVASSSWSQRLLTHYCLSIWVLSSTIEHYRALLSTIEHYWALLSGTIEHYQTLLSTIEHNWASWDDSLMSKHVIYDIGTEILLLQ